MQRATLLLRDVFDYSARGAAGALGLSEANARTTHLRARRASRRLRRAATSAHRGAPSTARDGGLAEIPGLRDRVETWPEWRRCWPRTRGR